MLNNTFKLSISTETIRLHLKNNNYTKKKAKYLEESMKDDKVSNYFGRRKKRSRKSKKKTHRKKYTKVRRTKSRKFARKS